MPETYAEIICRATDMSPEVFDELSDLIAAALFALGDGRGAKFVADPRDLTITFGFVFDAENEEIAPRALVVVRAALHAAGASTPGWPAAKDAFKFVEAKQRALVDA